MEVGNGTGKVRIEGAEVVIPLAGQRKRGLFGPMEPWETVIRVPLAQASATIRDRELVIRRSGAAVQGLAGCEPAVMAAFAEELEAAKLALATPKAACSHCGAPGQTVGIACGYCGHAVAGQPPGG